MSVMAQMTICSRVDSFSRHGERWAHHLQQDTADQRQGTGAGENSIN